MQPVPRAERCRPGGHKPSDRHRLHVVRAHIDAERHRVLSRDTAGARASHRFLKREHRAAGAVAVRLRHRFRHREAGLNLTRLHFRQDLKPERLLKSHGCHAQSAFVSSSTAEAASATRP